MGLTDPCSSYSSVRPNCAAVSENSRSSRSWPCRMPWRSAASSVGWRFPFGRWRKRSIAPSSSVTAGLDARADSSTTTILYQFNEHAFVLSTRARPTQGVHHDDRDQSIKLRTIRKMSPLRGSTLSVVGAGVMAEAIIAGATTETLRRGLEHGALVRVMPNTPAQIGEGV